jgi:hypothetical protein
VYGVVDRPSWLVHAYALVHLYALIACCWCHLVEGSSADQLCSFIITLHVLLEMLTVCTIAELLIDC